MVPGIPLNNFETDAPKIRSQINVVVNSPSVQAITDSGTGNSGVVFWHAKSSVTFPKGLTIGSEFPCVVLVKGTSLYVSDPTHELQTTTLSVNKKFMCSQCSSNGPNTDIRVIFPQGTLAGSTVRISIPEFPVINWRIPLKQCRKVILSKENLDFHWKAE